MEEEGTFYTSHKGTMRRIGFNVGIAADTAIINEAPLSLKQKQKYLNFIE